MITCPNPNSLYSTVLYRAPGVNSKVPPFSIRISPMIMRKTLM
jgi:hypothetical protein